MNKELMKKLNQQKNQQGFTLVELLIVLAVIAVLAILLLSAIPSFLDKQHATQDIKLAHDIVGAVGKFQNDCGTEPTAVGALYQSSFAGQGNTANGSDCAASGLWHGPYLSEGAATLSSDGTYITGAFGSSDRIMIKIGQPVVNGAAGVSQQDYVQFGGFNKSTAQYISQKLNGNPIYKQAGSQFYADCSNKNSCTGYIIFNNYN
jgi:type IV pilus assembly protein PilA